MLTDKRPMNMHVHNRDTPIPLPLCVGVGLFATILVRKLGKISACGRLTTNRSSEHHRHLVNDRNTKKSADWRRRQRAVATRHSQWAIAAHTRSLLVVPSHYVGFYC